MFSFYTTTIIARLLIAFELIIGVLLIAGLYKRGVLFSALGLISLYLIGFLILIIQRSEALCFCFGSLVEIPPVIGLVVYTFLLAILGMARNRSSRELRKQRLIVILLFVTLIPLPGILSPPDIFYHQLYPSTVNTPIPDRVVLSDTLQPYDTGSRVLLFSSPGCHYCQLAARKLSIMAQRAGATEKLIFYFWGDEESVHLFWEMAGIEPQPFVILHPAEIIDVTNGMFPTLFFIDNGKVIHRSGYRNFTDRHLKILK